jgi:hypothetical protein
MTLDLNFGIFFVNSYSKTFQQIRSVNDLLIEKLDINTFNNNNVESFLQISPTSLKYKNTENNVPLYFKMDSSNNKSSIILAPGAYYKLYINSINYQWQVVFRNVNPNSDKLIKSSNPFRSTSGQSMTKGEQYNAMTFSEDKYPIDRLWFKIVTPKGNYYMQNKVKPGSNKNPVTKIMTMANPDKYSKQYQYSFTLTSPGTDFYNNINAGLSSGLVKISQSILKSMLDNLPDNPEYIQKSFSNNGITTTDANVNWPNLKSSIINQTPSISYTDKDGNVRKLAQNEEAFAKNMTINNINFKIEDYSFKNWNKNWINSLNRNSGTIHQWYNFTDGISPIEETIKSDNNYYNPKMITQNGKKINEPGRPTPFLALHSDTYRVVDPSRTMVDEHICSWEGGGTPCTVTMINKQVSGEKPFNKVSDLQYKEIYEPDGGEAYITIGGHNLRFTDVTNINEPLDLNDAKSKQSKADPSILDKVLASLTSIGGPLNLINIGNNGNSGTNLLFNNDLFKELDGFRDEYTIFPSINALTTTSGNDSTSFTYPNNSKIFPGIKSGMISINGGTPIEIAKNPDLLFKQGDIITLGLENKSIQIINQLKTLSFLSPLGTTLSPILTGKPGTPKSHYPIHYNCYFNPSYGLPIYTRKYCSSFNLEYVKVVDLNGDKLGGCREKAGMAGCKFIAGDWICNTAAAIGKKAAEAEHGAGIAISCIGSKDGYFSNAKNLKVGEKCCDDDQCADGKKCALKNLDDNSMQCCKDGKVWLNLTEFACKYVLKEGEACEADDQCGFDSNNKPMKCQGKTVLEKGSCQSTIPPGDFQTPCATNENGWNYNVDMQDSICQNDNSISPGQDHGVCAALNDTKTAFCCPNTSQKKGEGWSTIPCADGDCLDDSKWCLDLPEGTPCKFTEQCSGDLTCWGSEGQKGGTCQNTKAPDYASCGHDEDCKSGACGNVSQDLSVKLCCPGGKKSAAKHYGSRDGAYAVIDRGYCENMKKDSLCYRDENCASGLFCKTDGKPATCSTKLDSGSVCTSDNQCKIGLCRYWKTNSTGDSDNKKLCCPNTTANGAFCGDLPIGSGCIQDSQCKGTSGCNEVSHTCDEYAGTSPGQVCQINQIFNGDSNLCSKCSVTGMGGKMHDDKYRCCPKNSVTGNYGTKQIGLDRYCMHLGEGDGCNVNVKGQCEPPYNCIGGICTLCNDNEVYAEKAMPFGRCFPKNDKCFSNSKDYSGKSTAHYTTNTDKIATWMRGVDNIYCNGLPDQNAFTNGENIKCNFDYYGKNRKYVCEKRQYGTTLAGHSWGAQAHWRALDGTGMWLNWCAQDSDCESGSCGNNGLCKMKCRSGFGMPCDKTCASTCGSYGCGGGVDGTNKDNKVHEAEKSVSDSIYTWGGDMLDDTVHGNTCGGGIEGKYCNTDANCDSTKNLYCHTKASFNDLAAPMPGKSGTCQKGPYKPTEFDNIVHGIMLIPEAIVSFAKTTETVGHAIVNFFASW